jgi:hypothetical protein
VTPLKGVVWFSLRTREGIDPQPSPSDFRGTARITAGRSAAPGKRHIVGGPDGGSKLKRIAPWATAVCSQFIMVALSALSTSAFAFHLSAKSRGLYYVLTVWPAWLVLAVGRGKQLAFTRLRAISEDAAPLDSALGQILRVEVPTVTALWMAGLLGLIWQGRIGLGLAAVALAWAPATLVVQYLSSYLIGFAPQRAVKVQLAYAVALQTTALGFSFFGDRALSMLIGAYGLIGVVFSCSLLYSLRIRLSRNRNHSNEVATLEARRIGKASLPWMFAMTFSWRADLVALTFRAPAGFVGDYVILAAVAAAVAPICAGLSMIVVPRSARAGTGARSARWASKVLIVSAAIHTIVGMIVWVLLPRVMKLFLPSHLSSLSGSARLLCGAACLLGTTRTVADLLRGGGREILSCIGDFVAGLTVFLWVIIDLPTTFIVVAERALIGAILGLIASLVVFAKTYLAAVDGLTLGARGSR